MNDEEIRKRITEVDDADIDLVNTGKTFQGWRIYGVIEKDRDPDKAYGVPWIILVKGEEIRWPSSKEYLDVLALANADYVDEDEDGDEEGDDELPCPLSGFGQKRREATSPKSRQ